MKPKRVKSKFDLIVSPPTWRCGLKQNKLVPLRQIPKVTSHVEVWIETCTASDYSDKVLVTSHVEVWIETERWRSLVPRQGHLPRGGVD